jgi:hypothetical protein
MAASYAGVSFNTDISGDEGFVNRWEQEAFITRRVIPYANKEDVQSAGRGNYRVTLKAYLTSDSSVATLQAAVGTTLRTLTNPFGDSVNYSNTMLVAVSDIRRRSWQQEWELTLEFERMGA